MQAIYRIHVNRLAHPVENPPPWIFRSQGWNCGIISLFLRKGASPNPRSSQISRAVGRSPRDRSCGHGERRIKARRRD